MKVALDLAEAHSLGFECCADWLHSVSGRAACPFYQRRPQPGAACGVSLVSSYWSLVPHQLVSCRLCSSPCLRTSVCAWRAQSHFAINMLLLLLSQLAFSVQQSMHGSARHRTWVSEPLSTALQVHQSGGNSGAQRAAQNFVWRRV